jgi:hypothetical protein
MVAQRETIFQPFVLLNFIWF